MKTRSWICRTAWLTLALSQGVLVVPVMAESARHGTIAALEPIENKGDNVPERTKRLKNAASNFGGMAGSFLGLKANSPLGAEAGAAAGTYAGTQVGEKVISNGAASHYMLKIRFDNKSQVIVTKPSAEVSGLAVGSRVSVTGKGEDMRITAE
ncbi:outer membrane lipoprotein SlyB [Xanthomonas axonopodis]|uniref:Outer membrane lipoprotein SlyB n=1 Tax=Xanthomonas euvesicatoria TaxID=456327 RepID=A0AAW3U4X1_XANEU|nr:hypothetical protein [Xanthomonas euvesicatoria]MBB4724117.1 outer membrane lipoprotein SlyB [Xanthomonas euvesicatoria]